jgi:hypothetical protein
MLDTVGDYLTEARVLLQDQTAPHRYPDTELKSALGMGIYETRRMRPDLFVFAGSTPDISSSSDDDDPVPVDEQYRLALVYFVVGQMGLRDEEEAAEARAAGYQRLFVAKLLSVAA